MAVFLRNYCYFIFKYIVDSSEDIFILCIIFVFNDFCFIGQVVPDNKYIHTYLRGGSNIDHGYR